MNKTEKSGKKARKPKYVSVWEKINKHLSKIFDEEELKENLYEEDDELEIDISFDFIKKWAKGLKKHSAKVKLISPTYLVALIVIIIVFTLIYSFSQTDMEIAPFVPPRYINGTYFDEQGNKVYNETPFMIYNPRTHDARLIVKEEVFIRLKKGYGVYVDLIYSFPGNQNVTKEEMQSVIIYRKSNVTAYIRKEVPYKNAFGGITHASISLNKKKDVWYSDQFKFNPLKNASNAGFIVLWGNRQEFPDGTVSPIKIFSSDKI